MTQSYKKWDGERKVQQQEMGFLSSQQDDSSLGPQTGSFCPRIEASIMAAAHPTPLSTVMAPV